MALRTVVCPECDTPVPYGRLSCPSCGSLLASVAGAPRRPAPLETVPELETPSLVDDDGDNHRNGATPEPHVAQPPADVPDTDVDAAWASGLERIGSEPEPAFPDPAFADLDEPEAELARADLDAPEPEPADEVSPVLAPGDVDDAAEPAPPDVETPSEPDVESTAAEPHVGGADADLAAPVEPESEEPRWPNQLPDPTWTSRQPPPVLQDWSPGPPTDAAARAPEPVPSWMPPSASADAPYAAPASAGAWVPPTVVPAAAEAAPAKGKAVRPGDAPLLADLPFDAPSDLQGWLVAAGSGIAVLGFLLPWSALIPFTSGDGYTDRWGLATPSHWILLAATLGLLGLSILPNRLPAWLRNGVVPLGLGGVLLGVVWPYVLGPFGAQIGSFGVALAALLLIIGGALTVRGLRHEAHPPRV